MEHNLSKSRLPPPMAIKLGKIREARSFRFLEAISGLGFVFLYPLFFLYHYSLGQGWIPPVLLGLYGPTTVAIAFLAAIPFLINYRFAPSARLTILFSLFLGYAILWTIWAGYISRDYEIPAGINNQYIAIIISWFALFIVGAFLNLNRSPFILACWAAWVVISLIVFFAFDARGMAFRAVAGGAERVATYQGFARSYFVLSLLLLSTMRRGLPILLVWTGSVTVLFAIGARSEFAAFILVTLAVGLLGQKRNPSRAALLLALAGIAAVAIFNTRNLLSGSRQFGLLNLGADTSWAARDAMNHFALHQISENPFFGVYGGSYFYNMQGVGSGAHNAFSAWVNFGLVGFCLYAGMIAASLLVATRCFLSFPDRPAARFALLMCASTAMLAITAKSVFWAEPALAWGLAAALVLTPPTSPGRRA